MNSNNTSKDTPSKYDNNTNEYRSKKPIVRNRGNSVANGQLSNKPNNTDMYTSPTLSVSSIQTTPLNKSYHKHSHSRSSSANSNNSSVRYNNIKSIMEKSETHKSSKLFNGSNLKNYSDNIEDGKIRIEISDMDLVDDCVVPGDLNNINKGTINISQMENDVTCQLYNRHSDATLNSAASNGNNENAALSESKKLNNDKLKTNTNSILSLKKPPSSQISISSSVKDNNSVRPASSDIGSYGQYLKPKSSVSYQYDSSARTLNNSNTTVLNSHAPNINAYASNNYLNSNYLEIRKKYSSCYSISSNSTILAPPKKYLNNNYSVYNYPKIKHMLCIVAIMVIIFFLGCYSLFSTRWVIANIGPEVKDEKKPGKEAYYEFGIFKFCYIENIDGNMEKQVCQSIEEKCPYFCTETSCIIFHSEGTKFNNGTAIENSNSSNQDYSFCKLTEKSRNIAMLYLLLFMLNIAISSIILYFIMKYRGTDRKNLKHKLIKRLSYISEHYNNKSSKLKNSNINLAANSNNNSSNTLNNNGNDFPVIGFHRQYSEPEAMDIENDTDTIKSKPKNNNNDNNNLISSTRANRYRSNSTHITYNIPNTATRVMDNNGNFSPPGNNSPFMSAASIEEQNKSIEDNEKAIEKRKLILRLLFSSLIILSLSLGFIGMYYVVKWYKEHRIMDLSNGQNFISIGVSLILICIISIVNIVIALYTSILLSVIHFSRSETYWHNDADEDTYSQSYDSLHPPSIYSQSNINPSNYSYNPNNNGYPSSSNTYIP